MMAMWGVVSGKRRGLGMDVSDSNDLACEGYAIR